MGLLAQLGLTPLGLPAPFDVSNLEAVAMLIFIGPVLEELLFRMALWNPVLDLSQNGEIVRSRSLAVLTTTLLFSYAHFHYTWFLEAGAIRDFVFYQTIYVLLLGDLCAYRLVQTRSILSPILVHIGFNLRFFIGIRLI